MDGLHEHGCKVTIEGLPPGILLNAPYGLGVSDKKAKKQIPTAEEDALSRCYWTDGKTSVAFPAENLRVGLIRATSGWKVPGNKKMSLMPIIAGDTSVFPDMIPFGTKKYGIDTRRVVIQKQGILRSRPRLNEWKLTFEVWWEGQYLGKDFHEELLPELLARLGGTIGIGDYRPERKGPFGRFKMVSIKKI